MKLFAGDLSDMLIDGFRLFFRGPFPRIIIGAAFPAGRTVNPAESGVQ